jgi:acetyl esterase/lipase
VLFGASAGGHLAMLAGSDPRRPRGVRAVVAIAPPTDLAWVGMRPELPLHASAALSIGCTMQQCPRAWRTASPITTVSRRRTPPTWVFTAGGDPITPIQPVRAYVAKLRRSGIPAALLTTRDPNAACHGAIPCSGLPLAGTRKDMFEHALSWIAPRIR